MTIRLGITRNGRCDLKTGLIVIKELWSFFREIYVTNDEVRQAVKRPGFIFKSLLFVGAIVTIGYVTYYANGELVNDYRNKYTSINREYSSLEKEYWGLRQEKFKLVTELEDSKHDLQLCTNRETAKTAATVKLNERIKKLEELLAKKSKVTSSRPPIPPYHSSLDRLMER